MKTAQKLLEERAKLWERAQEMVRTAEAEERDFTQEEENQWKQINTDMSALQRRAERLIQSEATDRLMNQVETPISARGTGGGDGASAVQTERYDEAFNTFMRRGMQHLEGDLRSLILQNFGMMSGAEGRALGTTTAAAGGALIPDAFMRRMIEEVVTFGGIFQSGATIISTESGNPMIFPTADDTANEGAILAENTQITEQDTTFDSISLGAYMYTSKLIRVPYQLLQDSAFDLPSWLARKLAERIGRILAKHFTTGTGVAQPQGVVTGATEGKVGANGQTTSVTWDDLIELQHSIDPVYRANARFMFNDSTLMAIRMLKDLDDRPIWMPSYVAGEPDRILNKPYVISWEMPEMAADAKSILYGDFSHYTIRRVQETRLMRLEERYADYLQVGMFSYARWDGKLLQPNAIKYYQNSAA